jgi:integral membrane sensor domain MASE1
VATVGFILFYHSEAPVLTTWLNWFASDALGIIMVAPLLIGLGSLRHDFPKKRELASGTLTLAALVIVTAITFGSPTHHWYTVLPLGMLLPALLAAYCRPVFAAAAALVLGFAVVWTTTFGIVDLSDLHDRVNAARSTLPAISICTLVLAALFAERRHKEKALKDSNDLLADGLQAGQVMTFEWDATTGQSRRRITPVSFLVMRVVS